MISSAESTTTKSLPRLSSCRRTSGKSSARISSGPSGRARRKEARMRQLPRLLGFISRVW
ncbi:hypothetical protein CsSME_00016611 [Camellia sinensis var. sinensis]